MPLSPDTTLGPYKIVDELGAGGMGEAASAPLVPACFDVGRQPFRIIVWTPDGAGLLIHRTLDPRGAGTFEQSADGVGDPEQLFPQAAWS